MIDGIVRTYSDDLLCWAGRLWMDIRVWVGLFLRHCRTFVKLDARRLAAGTGLDCFSTMARFEDVVEESKKVVLGYLNY